MPNTYVVSGFTTKEFILKRDLKRIQVSKVCSFTFLFVRKMVVQKSNSCDQRKLSEEDAMPTTTTPVVAAGGCMMKQLPSLLFCA